MDGWGGLDASACLCEPKVDGLGPSGEVVDFEKVRANFSRDVFIRRLATFSAEVVCKEFLPIYMNFASGLHDLCTTKGSIGTSFPDENSNLGVLLQNVHAARGGLELLLPFKEVWADLQTVQVFLKIRAHYFVHMVRTAASWVNSQKVGIPAIIELGLGATLQRLAQFTSAHIESFAAHDAQCLSCEELAHFWSCVWERGVQADAARLIPQTPSDLQFKRFKLQAKAKQMSKPSLIDLMRPIVGEDVLPELQALGVPVLRARYVDSILEQGSREDFRLMSDVLKQLLNGGEPSCKDEVARPDVWAASVASKTNSIVILDTLANLGPSPDVCRKAWLANLAGKHLTKTLNMLYRWQALKPPEAQAPEAQAPEAQPHDLFGLDSCLDEMSAKVVNGKNGSSKVSLFYTFPIDNGLKLHLQGEVHALSAGDEVVLVKNRLACGQLKFPDDTAFNLFLVPFATASNPESPFVCPGWMVKGITPTTRPPSMKVVESTLKCEFGIEDAPFLLLSVSVSVSVFVHVDVFVRSKYK
jgi:hypothetical protein